MDEVDFANNIREEMEADKVAAIRRRAAEIPKGEPGECDQCGIWFERTVQGRCARCRDKVPRKL